MTVLNTTNRALPHPDSAEVESAFPTLFATFANDLDFDLALLTPNVLGSRPAANTKPSGSVYLATDTGTLSLGDGAAWHTFSPQFQTVTTATNTTATDRQLVIVNANSLTVTLPAPVLHAQVGVKAAPGVIGTTVANGGGTIDGASSISLGTPGAKVLLQADGSNWNIIAGQQDTGWIALTLPGNIHNSTAITASVRMQGDRVQLKGGIVNNTGTDLPTLTTLATIPVVAMRPGVALPFPAVFTGGISPATNLAITTTGTILSPQTWPNGGTLDFDGITYSTS